MVAVKGMKWRVTPERTAHQKFRQATRKAYFRWQNMMRRCYDQKHPKFGLYGARGISVCDEWHDFYAYYRDVGDAPEGLSFDRVNNQGDYTPDNWRWATPKEQIANRRAYRPRRKKLPGGTTL